MHKVRVAAPVLETIQFFEAEGGFSSVDQFRAGEYSGYIGRFLPDSRNDSPIHLRSQLTTVHLSIEGSVKTIPVDVRVGPGCITPKQEAVYQAIGRLSGRADNGR